MESNMGDKKRGLILAYIILAEYHILWNLLYPYLWNYPYQQFEFVFAICLLVVTVLYISKQSFNSFGFIKGIQGFSNYRLTFEHLFIIALFIWFTVDCILQQCIDGKQYIQKNDWKLFCSAMAAFVFFPFVRVVGLKSSKAVIEQMIHVIVMIYTAFWGWALWQYFHLNFVTFPTGKHLYMVKDRWLEAGMNRNTTAAHSAMMLSLCVFMVVTQHIKIKTVYLFAALVHIAVVILTGSRTSYIAVVCTIVITVSFGLWKCCWNSTSIIKRIALIVIVFVVCVIILGWIKKGLFYILFYCVRVKTGRIISLSTAMRSYDSLSGRKTIWLGTMRMLLSDPKKFFIGVIPSEIGNTLVNMGLLKKTAPHCHNVLLEVGASLGVPAMLLYAWFLYSIFSRCKHMICLNSQQYEFVWMVSIVLLCLVVIDMAESFLFGPTSANMPIFHMFAGWITVLDECYIRVKKANGGNGTNDYLAI